MKVCFLTRAYPPRIGGSGRFAEILAKGLASKGVKVTVITQRVRGADSSEKENGVEIHRTWNLSDTNEFTVANLSLSIAAFTKKILDLPKHDIYHAHDSSVAGISGALAKKVINRPFLLKYGGDLVYEYLTTKRLKGWRPERGVPGTLEFKSFFACHIHWLQKWCFNSYDLICPNSDANANMLIAKGVNRNKIRILKNSVDLERMQIMPKEYAKEILGIKGKIILSASRLTGEKGLEILIRAMPMIHERHKARLIIAGDGPLGREMKQLAETLGICEKVEFVGGLNKQELNIYLNACDVFVASSYQDSTPNSLLEAMACCKPVIVSNIEGVKEVIGDDAGLCAGVADSHAIAKHVSYLLDSEQKMAEYGGRARKKIEEEYSLDGALNRYVQLYQSVKQHVV